MKMMIQADDYGITKAVVDGIVECAKQGMMTQTGIFTNMGWVNYAAERIKEVPHVLLGQDLNLSTGGPVTDPKLIPTLVQENGQFLTSSMHKKKDKEYNDAPGRLGYIQNLIKLGYSIYCIEEDKYADLTNGEEGNLYQIVLASTNRLARINSYLRRCDKKTDPLDMEAYNEWIRKLYDE